MPNLTQRQEAFCQAYAAEPNGAAAARGAGYSVPSARSQGSALLAKPEIAARIAELQAQAATTRAGESAALAAKLDPCYLAALKARDTTAVIQIVESQARIRSFVRGAPAIQMKLTALPAAVDPDRDHKLLLRLQQLDVDDEPYWQAMDEMMDEDPKKRRDDAAPNPDESQQIATNRNIA